MGRSIAVIVLGFILIGALATGIDMGTRAAFPAHFAAGGATSSVPILLWSILYVGVVATAGCWLTARLAPSHPMRHALILGAFGLAFNIMGSVRMWDTAPAWYHFAQLALTMVWAWLGGRIAEQGAARRASAAAPAVA